MAEPEHPASPATRQWGRAHPLIIDPDHSKQRQETFAGAERQDVAPFQVGDVVPRATHVLPRGLIACQLGTEFRKRCPPPRKHWLRDDG
jgi:hypothetical protein